MNTSGPTNISIKMEQFGDSGWEWTQSFTNPIDGLTATAAYRTNGSGDGLWRIGSYEGQWAHNYEDRQLRGTCQFSLSSKRRTAYGQIRRNVIREYSVTV